MHLQKELTTFTFNKLIIVSKSTSVLDSEFSNDKEIYYDDCGQISISVTFSAFLAAVKIRESNPTSMCQ